MRTFDAPEALDIRFYEVQAKSVLNRVPKASQMPFRWTINPYRGCAHACTYCARAIHRSSWPTGASPLAELPVGRLRSTAPSGAALSALRADRVLDHWSTIKTGLPDHARRRNRAGTSGDHRSSAGAAGSTSPERAGPSSAASLTLNNKLMGAGASRAPEGRPDYRRGYLCGLIRGDGHLARARTGDQRPTPRSHHFPARARRHRGPRARPDVPAERESRPTSSLFRPTPESAAMRAIRTQARDNVSAIELIDGRASPGRIGAKASSLASSTPRAATAGRPPDRKHRRRDHRLRAAYLRRFGFDVVVELTAKTNCLAYVRVRGGLREHLRFFHTVDPAITRKRDIEGLAIKIRAPLGVPSIEPLGLTMPLLRHHHRHRRLHRQRRGEPQLLRPAHPHLPRLQRRPRLRARDRRQGQHARGAARPSSGPSWKREHVAIGTNTDPYQWVEGSTS